MNCKIVALDSFVKEVKKLSKKYKLLSSDLKNLSQILQKNPKAGIKVQDNCYKIRVANSSIPTGKSGGFRVIYYYLDSNNNLYLMSIYAKTELANISDEKILQILKNNNLI